MDRDIADEGLPDGLPALTERLGRLVVELTALKAAVRDSQTVSPAPADTLQRKLLALFAQPVTGPESQTLIPYEEISPGIRVGFTEDAHLQLTVAPKRDYSASPEACLNTLHLSFSGSGWFSLEVTLAATEFARPRRYQFGLSARSSGAVRCRLVLRQSQQGTNQDTVLETFHIDPDERSYNLSGALMLPDEIDLMDAANPAFIVIFETAADLDLELNYLNLYFG